MDGRGAGSENVSGGIDGRAVLRRSRRPAVGCRIDVKAFWATGPHLHAPDCGLRENPIGKALPKPVA